MMYNLKNLSLTFFSLFWCYWCFQVSAHDKQQYVNNIFAGTDQLHSHDNFEDKKQTISKNFYSFTVEDIQGNTVDLGEYAGMVSM